MSVASCKLQVASGILLLAIAVSAQELVVTKSHKVDTVITIHDGYSVTIRTGYERKDGKITAKTAKVITRLDKEFSRYADDIEISDRDKKMLKHLLAQQEAKCRKHALANKCLIGYCKGKKLIWLFNGMTDKKIENEVKKIFQRSDIWDIRWEVDNTIDPAGIVDSKGKTNKK